MAAARLSLLPDILQPGPSGSPGDVYCVFTLPFVLFLSGSDEVRATAIKVALVVLKFLHFLLFVQSLSHL